jgi:hypothetical protein
MMDDFEPISVPGAISGSAIIDDLLNRISEKLSRDCALRETDAYQGYSATVQIRLQLADVYPVEVAAQVEVGTINPGQPSEQITVDTATVTADEVQERAGFESLSLERLVDESGFTLPKRIYVSRIRTAKKDKATW